MNKNENAILEYAKSHKHFNRCEIFTYLSDKMPISKATLSWYLNVLTQKRLLARIGHGVYTVADKNIFAPNPSEETKKVFSFLNENFPFANFCIYEGNIISPLQHHLSQNNIIYIETNREAIETIFNLLKDNGKTVYLKPDKNLIYHYIDLGEQAFFIKPLISESPLQIIDDIPTPTIEKILVDIHKDKDFFYLQGSESNYIFENAFNLFTINETKLLRYASRRGIREEINSQINLLKL